MKKNLATAESFKNLRKRMEYFCSSSTPRQHELTAFIRETFEGCQPYIFGGVIRDIGIRGLKSFHSDVDIVYEGDIKHKNLPKNIVTNKFGGSRAFHGRWIIDFWKAEDTWSFKHANALYQGPQSLLETTTTNFESALYDVRRKKLICREGYIEDINEGYLRIINPITPDDFKALKRIILSTYKNQINYYDQTVCLFINRIIKRNGERKTIELLSNLSIEKPFLYNLLLEVSRKPDDLLPLNISSTWDLQKTISLKKQTL